MRRLAVLAVLLPLIAAAPAEAKVTCGSGTTAFVDGNLRIFGIHYRTPDEWGFDEYACLGRRRPLAVGLAGSTTGTGSAATPVFAHSGRFLASYSQTDGEGGPSAHVSVVDMIRRKGVSFMNVACCEWTPAIRLASDGTVAVNAPGEGVLVKSPGRRARTLAAEGSGARDLAMFGGTVYWSEGGQARSSQLPGANGIEASALEPVRLRRRRDPCTATRGRTIAASGSVRVYETPDARWACRVGRRGRILLSGSTPPRIVGDRWLLVYGEGSARVIDTRTLRAVMSEQPVGQVTLLRDGTLAWTNFTGRLMVRSPGADAVVLSEAAATLAAARRAVYWTEDGIPRRYAPPKAAKSASKPG